MNSVAISRLMNSPKVKNPALSAEVAQEEEVEVEEKPKKKAAPRKKPESKAKQEPGVDSTTLRPGKLMTDATELRMIPVQTKPESKVKATGTVASDDSYEFLSGWVLSYPAKNVRPGTDTYTFLAQMVPSPTTAWAKTTNSPTLTNHLYDGPAESAEIHAPRIDPIPPISQADSTTEWALLKRRFVPSIIARQSRA